MQANNDIRAKAAEKHVFLWEIAMKLNMNDGNLSRKLRTELPEEEKSKIIYIINEIAREKENVAV